MLYERRRDSWELLESFNDLSELSEEVICLYVYLDECINNCSLTDKQLIILKKYMDGFTEEEIANDLSVTQQAINGIINSCCKKIVEYNHQKWKNEFILWNKKKVETNYKQCSKCKEFLPATEEYFSHKGDTKDGFHPYCKKCR